MKRGACDFRATEPAHVHVQSDAVSPRIRRHAEWKLVARQVVPRENVDAGGRIGDGVNVKQHDSAVAGLVRQAVVVNLVASDDDLAACTIVVVVDSHDPATSCVVLQETTTKC